MVGQSGVVLSSPNTTTWTVQYSGTTANLRAVAVDPAGYYSGAVLRNGPYGTFGAVGDDGVFITSCDGGVNWTVQKTETVRNLRGIAFESGGFLAVGESGTIEAGFIWVKRSSGVAYSLNSIAWGSNRFVTVGDNGVIIASSNGAYWEICDSGTSINLLKVIYGSGCFVAVGNGNSAFISTNGVNWNSMVISQGATFRSVAYGSGKYIAVGSVAGSPMSFISTNAIDWSPGASIPAALNDLTYGDNIFCGVGNSGVVLTTHDGQQWSPQNPGFSYSISAINFGNGMFQASGQYIIDTGARMLASVDGTNWSTHQTGHFSGAPCAGNNAFVAASAPGNIGFDLGSAFITSSDGINWTSRGVASITEVPQNLNSIAFGAGKFVTVGAGGFISQSVSNPDLLGINMIPNGIEITLIGDIGRTMVLETAPDLIASNWTSMWIVTNAPYKTNYIDSSTNSHRFYRIRR